MNFYGLKCVWPMFDRPVFGWLPWAPGVSKKFFLTGNVLAISCSFKTNTQKILSRIIFPTFLVNFKNLKNITLKRKYENWNLQSSPDFGSRAILGTLYLSRATWSRGGLIVALTTHYVTLKNAHQKFVHFQGFCKKKFFFNFEPCKFL